MHPHSRHAKTFRIALTGGPGGGKTTAADAFRDVASHYPVAVVPETATLLFSGGFPRSAVAEAKRFAQTAIYHVQLNMEAMQAVLLPGHVLLCDRGTLDGAAYWPGSDEDYFATIGTTWEAELARYDGVVFFETAALGGASIGEGNPIRNETLAEAIEIDTRLRGLWSAHPRFVLVPHQETFSGKIRLGSSAVERLIADLHCKTMDA